MNRSFRLRFDQMREGNPTRSDEEGEAPLSTAALQERPRNLGVIWPDGRQYFFAYAYLVAGEFKGNGENNVVQLQFSAHLVTIQGYGLEPLFLDIMEQTIRWIVVQDERYTVIEENSTVWVTNVQIEAKT